jgi:hypothetical protein
MKKLVYSIVSIISLLCLASCAQDEKLILDPDNFVASSWKQTFDDVFVLDKNAAETDWPSLSGPLPNLATMLLFPTPFSWL